MGVHDLATAFSHASRLDARNELQLAPAMRAATREVIARFSTLKVFGWSIGSGLVCAYLIATEAKEGWPEWGASRGDPGWLGAGVAFLWLCIVVALLVRLALTRGAAIARVGDNFVLYGLLTKRVPVGRGLTVRATWRESTPGREQQIGLKPGVSRQLTLCRPGQPDVNYPTMLLSENAETIAQRMSELTH